MRINRWAILIVITGIALIIIHGFWSDVFKVDYFTVIILVIICIPYFSQFLKRAKVAGAEFEFRDEIESTKKVVEESIEKSKSKNKGQMKPLPFETFNVSTAKEVVDTDHILALASLRIEIEKKSRLAAKFFKLGGAKNRLSEIIDALLSKGILSSEQVSALRKIIDMCNKAVHGVDVSKREAKDIINLMEELNQSFSIGYSIDFTKNRDYKKHGLECEWEHCIEFMPLESVRTEKSCPIFGHNCPEGLHKASECKPRALKSIAKTIKSYGEYPRNKERKKE
jgi:polyhydroxyalkanoate synthesis regulator phasin